jgi:hypothetical protein
MALVFLHLLLGLSAIAAGQALALKPTGEALSFETDWLKGSPFADYRVPGLFLALVIGGANLAAMVAQWRRLAVAPLLSLGTGLLLVTWLAIQTSIIGYKHWSQLIWGVVFPLVAVLGLVQLRTRRG